jgi:hypothetical protein
MYAWAHLKNSRTQVIQVSVQEERSSTCQSEKPAFSVGGVQGMQAKVATSYCHALYAELSEEEKMSAPAMKTVLEAIVSTLDRPVLTVGSVSAFTYAKNRVMINVSLHCNAPLPFLSRNGTSRFLSSMLAMV